MLLLRTALRFLALMTLCAAPGEADFYGSLVYGGYEPGTGRRHGVGKHGGRNENRCAYVVEKTVSFMVQDGAAPYVKAEYNKCSWAQKCPTLQYRLLYKPLYKVAHKSVTELEWRCCPGYSGYGCTEGPPPRRHQMGTPPLFKGPPYKGPVFKGPLFKGPPFPSAVKAGPWGDGPGGGPRAGYRHFPGRRLGPAPPDYPDSSFQTFLPVQEAGPGHGEEGHGELGGDGHGAEDERVGGAGLGEDDHAGFEPEQTPPPSDGERNEDAAEGRDPDRQTEERIYRMEEDVGRLSRGLESLRGTVAGLEESLRASLREDANRMLSALLAAAPGPLPAPAAAAAAGPLTVGFAEIPGRSSEAGEVDGGPVPPGLAELSGRIEEVRAQLEAKTAELRELRATVASHAGALRKISDGAGGEAAPAGRAGGNEQTDSQSLPDAAATAAAAAADLLSDLPAGAESRLERAEARCQEGAEEALRRCREERRERHGRTQEDLEERDAAWTGQLTSLRARVQKPDGEGCCAAAGGLGERLRLLEASVAGLNRSQRHLGLELGGHKDHVEGMLEGRLAYVEDKLNLTLQLRNAESERRGGASERAEAGGGLEGRMEAKLRALEGRLLSVLEEAGNASAPALLEGHAVPALETELDSLRERLQTDVDRMQRHLGSLESRCSSPSALQGDSPKAAAEEQEVREALRRQEGRLSGLNVTLQSVIGRLSARERREQEDGDAPLQGQLTVLSFDVRSVNRTLRGVQESLGSVIHRVGRANSSWHEREARLARQMKGVVQLMGRQASMLGAGERRLTRLKGELQDVKKRLAAEVRGCRSTAMGVQKEVSEVGGRVAHVEDQCKGLGSLAEDLEKIRQELERQSNGLLPRLDAAAAADGRQPSELRDQTRNCSSRAEPGPGASEPGPGPARGDTFVPK